jgi:S-DNA-T family DNA segregation ATPase FtsK/SpoIIIE
MTDSSTDLDQAVPQPLNGHARHLDYLPLPPRPADDEQLVDDAKPGSVAIPDATPDERGTHTVGTPSGPQPLITNEGSARVPFRARVRTVATHPGARATVRQAAYVGLGAKVTARRTWEARSTARHARMMRAAEAAGDHQAAREWEQRAEHFREARHKRRMALLHAPVIAAKSLIWGAAGLFALGVLMAITAHHVGDVMRPLGDVVGAIRWTLATAAGLWSPVTTFGPWAALAVVWAVGRSHAQSSSSSWLMALKPADGETGTVVTADGIARALQHLGISELNKAVKDGWIPAFTTPPVREGRGYRAILELPYGVTPGMVADQREKLARNLYRSPIEVWPADAAQDGTGRAGFLDLWVADAGALSKPAPEYPLLHSGVTDVFTGVPVGVSPRGDLLTIQLNGNNFVAGGMMGQGKSNACRVVILGAALDPLAELRVYVFAGNGDFDAYRPRLARYERGATDEVAKAGLEGLRELYDEVARRENRLRELGAKKLTRGLAEKHPDMRPIVALFSECHELFGHKEYGEEAADLAAKTLRRARKTGIILGFDTQSARKEAIPPKIVELVSVNACFYVKSWRSNDGFLGDGSFAAGIRATDLRPGTDRGTSLITGVSDAPFELLKWHFVEVDDDTGFDAAADVIARAMGKVDKRTPVAANAPKPVVETRDLLEDLDAVLGKEPVPIADVPPLLRDLAPNWRPYVGLKGNALVKQLAEFGIKVPSTGNRWPLNPAAVRSALAARPAKDGGGQSG